MSLPKQLPPVFMTPAEIELARERGRQKSLTNVINNPEARVRVETAYGVEFCRSKWPEAYGLSKQTWSEWFARTFGVGAFRGASNRA